jgi:putative phosphonate metabolism protein
MSEPAARYAIYYAPASSSALGRFGAAWVGRDAATGEALAQPAVPGIDGERLAAITAEARRYGFHATLKAPFRLAPGKSREALLDAAAAFAAARRPFPLPPLALAELDGFLALMPDGRPETVHALADDCVAAFDRFRAPPDDAEIARRRAAGLTPAQDANLVRWGYPYVFDEFRFHLTLTNRLDAAARAQVRDRLAPLLVDVLAEPAAVDSVCVFEEPAPGAAFRLAARSSFGSS